MQSFAADCQRAKPVIKAVSSRSFPSLRRWVFSECGSVRKWRWTADKVSAFRGIHAPARYFKMYDPCRQPDRAVVGPDFAAMVQPHRREGPTNLPIFAWMMTMVRWHLWLAISLGDPTLRVGHFPYRADGGSAGH